MLFELRKGPLSEDEESKPSVNCYTRVGQSIESIQFSLQRSMQSLSVTSIPLAIMLSGKTKLSVSDGWDFMLEFNVLSHHMYDMTETLDVHMYNPIFSYDFSL